jgi:putative oxidoreductase
MGKVGKMDIAILLLRIALGVIFVAHGAQKLFGLFGGSGIEGLSAMMQGIGMKPAAFWAWVVALSEGVGGLLLLLGILPRVCSGLIAVIMVVAIAKVHGANGFFSQAGGFEYQFLILLVSIGITFSGAGKLSLYNKY